MPLMVEFRGFYGLRYISLTSWGLLKCNIHQDIKTVVFFIPLFLKNNMYLWTFKIKKGDSVDKFMSTPSIYNIYIYIYKYCEF